MFGRRTLELCIGAAVIAGTVGIAREIHRRQLLGARLRHALSQENLPVALGCVRAGADPNLQPARKPTALILAVAYRDTTAAQELLHAGADPNREVRWWGQPSGYCMPIEEEFRHSALSLSAVNSDPRMVRLLLQNGADPHRRNSRGKIPAELARNPRVKKLLLAAERSNDASAGLE
ncbi:MAG: ankyrin repeat domain-containing protein [Armatimonadota bacterium]